MLKAEWKSLLQNRFMIIVLVALALVPGLYQLIFLNSMWDVYGRMGDLPVAVVNNDQAVKFSGKTMNLGKEISSQLKNKKTMDFHFVDAHEAAKGIKDGNYYLVIIFPADFSRDATSLLTNQPKTLQLHYQTSQGHSYTASKLSASAVTALQGTVSQQITQLYVTNVLKEFGSTGKALDSAADGADTLLTGEKKITAGSTLIAKKLVALSDGALQFSNGTQQFSVGAQQYVHAVGSASDGAHKLSAGATQLNTAGGTLAQGASKLASGATQLSSGTSSFASGVSSLAQGTQSLASNGKTLNTGAQSLNTAVTNGAKTLNSGAQSLSTGVSKLNAALTQTPQQQHAIATLTAGVSGTNQDVQDMNSIIQKLPDAHNLASLQQSSENNKKQLVSLTKQLDELQSSSSANASDAGTQDAAAMKRTAEALQVVASSMSTDQDKLAQLEATGGSISTAKAKSQQLADQSAQVLPNAATTMQTLEQGLQSSGQAVQKELLPGAARLQDGVETYTTGIGDGISKLSAGLQSYVTGVNQLNTGANTLSAHTGTLVLGAQGLAGGLHTLDTNVPQLTGGLASMQQASSTLASGLQTLNAKASTLTNATQSLNTASTSIAQGSKKLVDAQGQVSSGADKVSGGLATLSSKLGKGSQSIAAVNTGKSAAKAVSTPVTTQHVDHDSVANNGTGMAPYMISVALYVGTLAINMMYDAAIAKKKPTSGIAWWASKMSVLGVVAIIQALLVDGVVVKMLGLNPLNHLQFLGILILISAMNMSFVTFFNVLLGKVGAFLMMIFLMVQLGASAGTYPIQLSGGFYQAIHPWIPMTYAIDALRESISIGGSVTAPALMLGAILVVANLLMILVFARRKGMSSVGFERQQELDAKDAARSSKDNARTGHIKVSPRSKARRAALARI